MSPKKGLKIAIDIVMFLLFGLLMGAHLTSAALHEWLGIGLFMFFIVHNILNYKWYKALFKGKYKTLRIVQTTVNLLLFLAVIGCVISALMISGVVFRDIRLPGIELGRKLHMLCTAWGFVLMSIHLGLHIRTLRQKKIIKYIVCAVTLAVTAYGIFVFAERKMWEELFLLAEYKMFDYNKTVVIYWAQTITVSLAIANITYYVKKFGLYIKEKRNAEKD